MLQLIEFLQFSLRGNGFKQLMRNLRVRLMKVVTYVFVCVLGIFFVFFYGIFFIRFDGGIAPCFSFLILFFSRKSSTHSVEVNIVLFLAFRPQLDFFSEFLLVVTARLPMLQHLHFHDLMRFAQNQTP